MARPLRQKLRELPKNPVVGEGVRFVYLGLGLTRVAGGKTGLLYYVSSERRDLVAHKDDAPGFLRRSDFTLAPTGRGNGR